MHMRLLSIKRISDITLGTQANLLECSHLNSFITEMWVKACVAFFPAFHHFEGAYLTLILAINAHRCRWLFFGFFPFIITFRFATEDIFKAFIASKPAC